MRLISFPVKAIGVSARKTTPQSKMLGRWFQEAPGTGENMGYMLLKFKFR